MNIKDILSFKNYIKGIDEDLSEQELESRYLGYLKKFSIIHYKRFKKELIWTQKPKQKE